MRFLELIPEEKRNEFRSAYCALRKPLDLAITLSIYICDAAKKSRNPLFDLPPNYLTLDFIDIMDSTAVIVEQGSAFPCTSLLRSAFESFLALAYMLEKKTEYGQRCADYGYWYWYMQMECLDRNDPKSPSGKSLKGELTNDLFFTELDVSTMGI